MPDLTEFLERLSAKALETPEAAVNLLAEGFELMGAGLAELAARIDNLEASLRERDK